MTASDNFRFETLAIHAGQEPDPTHGAVMTPIVLSSTFAQSGPGVHKGFEYSRTDNPTRHALEACFAELEGGKHGMAFSSGCAAMTTLLHVLSPGDHVVAGDDMYGGSFRILDKVMKPIGINHTLVDLADLGSLEKSFTAQTKLIWLETPTNPMLKLVDIAAVCAIAKKHNVKVVVDNTFATPYLQKPLELGASAVVHSTTKYLNGHSDVVGGCIVTSDDAFADKIRFLQNAMGAIQSPFDSYMVLRGLKTLHVRMDRHVSSATKLAQFLEGHPQVEKVIYPGLPSHPSFELCKKQMRGAGGMISFVVKGGETAARAFLEAVKIFTCAESLGGVESLIELPCVMTHGSIPPEQREALGIAPGLIRASVGIESYEDLENDIVSGLKAAAKTMG